MGNAARRFRPNSPPILQETVDDDTIIVDLDTGSYYHLTGSGAYVWRLLESGLDLAGVGEALEGFYGIPVTDAARAVDDLAAELSAEGLLVERDPADPGAAAPVVAPSVNDFRPPVLAKHTDMQELLLLDPIHDVDETGWPAAR